MNKQERINIFINRLASKNLELLSEYTNARTKVSIKCLSCGEVFDKVPYLIKTEDVPCPTCLKNISSSRAMTKEEINLRLSRDKPGFHVVGECNGGMNNKCMIHHDLCGNDFEATPHNLVRVPHSNKGCPYCSNTHRYTDSEICSYIISHAKGYRFVKSFYDNHHLTITVIHEACGYKYDVMFNVFTRPSRCPKCSHSVLKAADEFRKEFCDLMSSEYTLLSDYKGSHKYVKVSHKKCGTVYSVSPTSILSGARCPKCKFSRGEQLVSRALDSLKINYEFQKKFDDCINVERLPFDFYINSLRVAIEYDGIQHYKPVEYFGGSSKYKISHKRDLIKNKYCIEHGINLYRIPYTLSKHAVKCTVCNIINGDPTANKFLVR